MWKTIKIFDCQVSSLRSILRHTLGLFKKHDKIWAYLTISCTLIKDNAQVYALNTYSLQICSNIYMQPIFMVILTHGNVIGDLLPLATQEPLVHAKTKHKHTKEEGARKKNNVVDATGKEHNAWSSRASIQ